MIEQLRYVRLPAVDRKIASEFAAGILGLAPVPAVAGTSRFRSDERSYSLEYDSTGGTRLPVLGLEVRIADQLDEISGRLAQRGLPAQRLQPEQCATRQVYDGVTFLDHSGNSIELVVRPENKGGSPFLSRDCGITSFSGVSLRSTAVAQDVALWLDVLGCKVRDYVGGSVYLGFDAAHHRIALHPASKSGLLSISYDVADFDHLMHSNYFLLERQIKILHGPGREPFSKKVFLSFCGPEGMIFTYSTGIANVGSDWVPRQFSNTPDSFCSWGSPVHIKEIAGKSAI